MKMEESIRKFQEQFNFKPQIENSENFNLKKIRKIIIGGMGGSHLAGDILKNLLPEISIKIHKNYGLPTGHKREETLIIASSFSGNTEEGIDFAEQALKERYLLAVVTKGGKLLEMAEENNLPFIKLPETEIQPRMALGYSIISLAKLLGQEKILKNLGQLSSKLDPNSLKESGKNLSEEIKEKIPVIYVSERNEPIAYNWKIKFNETAKIPSFFNVFPELNHNEMEGFDCNAESKILSERLAIVMIEDDEDDKKIQKRMKIFSEIMKEKTVIVKNLKTEGENRLEKIFNSLLLADWTAFHTAKIYGHDTDKVRLIEEFKKKLRK